VHTVDVEALIPAHHLLRKIEQHVDFSFIGELTAPYYCPTHGRPSIDPEIFFRLVLVGYLYNIHSDRQLCEEVQYNLAYRWFCKLNLEDNVPDHSSLTTLRQRFGIAVFQQFFERILEQCRAKGLVKAQRLMTDSTLMAANASLDSLIVRPSSEATTSAKTRLKISNQTHISRTDPEATLAQKRGKPNGLKYKAHLAIDADSRVIVDTQVTTGAVHDSQPYLEQLARIQRLLGVWFWIVIADRAYGTGAILAFLLQQSITPVIPLFSRRSGGSVVGEAEGFYYEADHDRYRCPTGHHLVPYPTPPKDGRVIYHSQADVCKSCVQQLTCAARRKGHTPTRLVGRHVHQAIFEHIQQQMATHAFIQQQHERFWKMEGIISEAKHRQGLGRAKYRGLVNTQIQAYLSACAQNIKRLVAFYWFLRVISYLFNPYSLLRGLHRK
jgi:transposase